MSDKCLIHTCVNNVYINIYIYKQHSLDFPQITDFGKMMTGLLSMAMFGFNIRFLGVYDVYVY